MEFLSLQPLIWLAAIAVLLLGLRYSLVDLPLVQQLASFVLRVLGIALLVVALCRPFWSEDSRDLHVLFLVDVSQSVDLDAAKNALVSVGDQINSLKSGDSWSLFAVGETVRQFSSTEEFSRQMDQWQTGVSDDQFRSATKLASGMLQSRLAFPAGKSRRIVLFTDGQETHDNLDVTLRQLQDEKVDVRLVKMSGLSEPECAVVAIEPSSPNAFHGEIVRMAIQVAANQSITSKLRILHKGVAVTDEEVQLSSGQNNLFYVDVEMTTSGASLWTAELVPEMDHFPNNNQASCSVNVQGKPRVLVLHADSSEMRAMQRILEEQNFEIDVRGKFGLPDTMEGMLAFDAIVLADLPATDIEPRQMQLLKQFVSDFGGGLVMLGSENSFGLGGYFKTPVEEVLPLVSRFEKEKEKPALAMVLVIDKSGSMQGLPIALARQAAKAAVELLSPRDMIGVVAFDGQPYLVSEITSAGDADTVNAAIDSLAAGGGTYMYPAMEIAKDMLENASAKIRHMICLSDGHTQPADHEGLTQAMKDAGITVSTVALGGADRQLMETIAEIGGGRYYETDNPENVPQIFTKETMQASRSAIKEDIFGTVRTGDHQIVSGYADDQFPFSLGYVMTEAKPTAQVLLVAETGDPLLAQSRFGLGTGLAFTCDLTERWGGEWLSWDDCGKFWAQALRCIVRKEDARGVHIEQSVDATNWNLSITRTAANGEPVNGVNWEITALDEVGKRHEVAAREVGLGRYTADVKLENQSRMTLRLHDVDHDRLKVLHYHQPYPAEYRLSQEMPSALAALGPPPLDLHEDLVPERRRKSISHYAHFAALACLFGSVLLRRV